MIWMVRLTSGERDKEKYKMRAGVSILDIGGMKFQKGALNRDFKN